MWAALLGALVGGFFALAGSVAVELRRERRQRIGGARLILSQLERSQFELAILLDDEDAWDGYWCEGPHEAIRTDAWQTHAADFVGRLSEEDFRLVDGFHWTLNSFGQHGVNRNDVDGLGEHLASAKEILKGVMEPTWFDRHVWRL